MKLNEIALFTSQVDEVTDFYTCIFGSEPKYQSSGKSVFELEGLDFMIHKGTPPLGHKGPLFDESGYPPDGDHFAFSVQNLDDYCNKLRNQGIEAMPRNFPWGLSAYLLDPDGRVIEIQLDGNC